MPSFVQIAVGFLFPHQNLHKPGNSCSRWEIQAKKAFQILRELIPTPKNDSVIFQAKVLIFSLLHYIWCCERGSGYVFFVKKSPFLSKKADFYGFF